MAKVTAVLPAYNKELCISSIILGSKKYADRIIVVDDGSTDKTAEIAELAGAEIIKHQSNKGRGAALKTGFEAAKTSEVIVTLDASGQYKPEEIPKLVTPIIEGKADIVNGSRYINGNRKDTPFYNRINQSLTDKITHLKSGTSITDIQSGFRAFARYSIPAFKFNCINFGIESEMLMDAANAGLRIKEVEIQTRCKVSISTKNYLNQFIEVLIEIIKNIQFQKPLFYFVLPGAVITLAGIFSSLILFNDYIVKSSIIPSAPSSLAPIIFAVVMTMAGGFLVLTGVLLDSMEKMIDRFLIGSQNKISVSKSTKGIDFSKSETVDLKGK